MAPDSLEQHKAEVCAAFARAAVAMRDAANTAENFSNWFTRVNNMQNIPLPPAFNGNFSFMPTYGGPQQQYPTQAPTPEQQTGKKRKAVDDADGPKKRREKKPKDTNAPKRPPSPYLLFQNDVRKTIQAQNPDIPYSQLLATIAKMWKTMTPEEKAPYQASQAVLKAKYEQEKQDYETNPLNPLAPAPAATKESAATPAVSKTVADVVAATSDDSSDESTETSSSSDEKEEDEEEEEPEPVPEPPRKKSKKEAAKVQTPPAKVSKKKEKTSEGKKKKKADS